MARKYQQRGYQDDGDRPKKQLAHEPKGDGRPRRAYGLREPRKVNMPGFHDVLKCARCGASLAGAIQFDSQCSQCASDLHTCAQCCWFDTSSAFECSQLITERVSPKDERNSCSFFEACVTVERETSSTSSTAATDSLSPEAGDARQAFDDLFK